MRYAAGTAGFLSGACIGYLVAYFASFIFVGPTVSFLFTLWEPMAQVAFVIEKIMVYITLALGTLVGGSIGWGMAQERINRGSAS